MNWLFWKEYRQNRVVVTTLITMVVVPHLFGLCAMACDWYQSRRANIVIFEHWEPILAGASLFSLVVSQLALALIGGNAIAGERADRSAEFQVYLPLTREKILAAKLLLASAIAAGVWLINPFILWATLVSSGDHPLVAGMAPFVILVAITGLVFFCVAWFFSSFLRSPTFSIAAGLITPLIIIGLVIYGVYLVKGDRWDSGTDSIIKICYVCISLAVALPSFGFGTWLYLRRVEA